MSRADYTRRSAKELWGRRGLLLPRRIVRRVGVGRPRRPGPGDLNRHALTASHREVIRVGRLSVETARRERLERLLVELRAVAKVPRPRNNRRDAIVRMRVRLDLRVRPDAQQ